MEYRGINLIQMSEIEKKTRMEDIPTKGEEDTTTVKIDQKNES